MDKFTAENSPFNELYSVIDYMVRVALSEMIFRSPAKEDTVLCHATHPLQRFSNMGLKDIFARNCPGGYDARYRSRIFPPLFE